MKIGTKIGFASGMILAFLAVVSAVAFFGLTRANDSFGSYRSLARQSNEMGRSEASLLSARLSAKDFLVENTQEAEQKVREQVEATVQAIDGTIALFESAESIKAMEQASVEVHEYQSAFEEVADLAHEHDALVAEMNEVGPKAEEDLTALMQSAFDAGDAEASYLAGTTLRHLLLGRLYANRFLIDSKKESVDRTIHELTEFEQAAERMRSVLQDPERHRLAVEVVELAKRYEETFAKAVDVTYARNGIVQDRLDALGRKLAHEIEQIALHNKELQDELGPRASAEMERLEWLALIVSAIAILLGIVLAVATGRAISRPLVAMTSAMGKLAGGDHSIEVPARGRRDEVGQMADAVQVFKDSAIETVRLDAERAKEQEEKQVRAERIQSLSLQFKKDVKNVLEAMASGASELESTAQSMSATAEETNRQSTAVAAAAEEASTNVQTVASAAEELSSSIEEVGRQVGQSAKIAGNAVTEAEATNTSVKGLAQAAEKIGEVVSLIQDIAEQTNLLALNATIEAARAGEAGKGFAVVASEVKSLATQTAKATEEIGGQIAAIQGSTGEAVQAIEGIGKIIHELDQIAASVASAMEEQGAATQEIARNVQQAAAGTSEVSSNVGGIAQAAGETGAASSEVLTAAQGLAQQSEVLRAEIDRFLGAVEAA